MELEHFRVDVRIRFNRLLRFDNEHLYEFEKFFPQTSSWEILPRGKSKGNYYESNLLRLFFEQKCKLDVAWDGIEFSTSFVPENFTDDKGLLLNYFFKGMETMLGLKGFRRIERTELIAASLLKCEPNAGSLQKLFSGFFTEDFNLAFNKNPDATSNADSFPAHFNFHLDRIIGEQRLGTDFIAINKENPLESYFKYVANDSKHLIDAQGIAIHSFSFEDTNMLKESWQPKRTRKAIKTFLTAHEKAAQFLDDRMKDA